MPELPDLLYVRSKLEEAFAGRSVQAARLAKPVVLRSLVSGDLSLLVGQRLTTIERHLHFLVFCFPLHELVVNPMLAGRFRIAKPTERVEGAYALGLDFGDHELRYLDDKQMGKVYLAAGGQRSRIPGYDAGGIDILSEEFTLERFSRLVSARRDQVRVFLLDKSALDSLGNAYADEVLFEAGIHPKTWCRSLSPEDIKRLHSSIVGVVRGATAEVAR